MNMSGLSRTIYMSKKARYRNTFFHSFEMYQDIFIRSLTVEIITIQSFMHTRE